MADARDMYSRAAWTAGFALVLYINSRGDYPGPALNMLLVLLAIAAAFVGAGYAVRWLNSTGQARVRDQILDAAAVTGSERVLDYGGTLGVLVAKRMKSGKVIAIAESSETEGLREFARREGVVDKVRFEAGDIKKLTYPDSNFDVVVSSRALDGLDDANCSRAIQELSRVLKPGGRLVVHAIGDSGRFMAAFGAAKLADFSATPTSLPFSLGGRVFFARKTT